MSMKLRAVLFCLAFTFAGAALAAKAPPPSIDARGEDLAGQRAAVEKEMEQGERFAEISDEDKAAVFAALDRMEKLLAGRGVAQLDQSEKVVLINDQELVNALLTKANIDSRVQCRREKRVGSHRTTSTCRTVAAWRRASEQSREDIEKRRSMGDILPQEKPGGGLRGRGGN
jgi:hypothetical protein